MFCIISGIKALGFGGVLAYTFVMFILFWLIDSKLYNAIETLLGMEHKIYWYDVITLIGFIILYIYGLYIFGK
jgi:hypothetical protein